MAADSWARHPRGFHVVRACCVPGTVLGAGDTALSKAVKNPLLVGWGNRVKKVCRLIYGARQC